MSAYKEFSNVQFANANLLISALAELGYEVEVGEALQLRGFGTQRATAQVAVRHEQIKDWYYDFGFAWNGQAFVPIIENGMASCLLDEEWRQKLQATYAKLAILTFLTRTGADIGQVKQLEDGSLTFSATMEVQR